MALVINDRVKENSTTSGTGNITLAGVASGQGNVTFNSAIGTGNTTYYCIFEQGTNTFEIGLGTLSGSTTLERTTVINNSSGNTSKISFTGGTLDATSANLTRGSGATIFSSSNSDNVVDFGSGTKDVFCTLPASKSVFLDASGDPVGAASAGFALAMAVAL